MDCVRVLFEKMRSKSTMMGMIREEVQGEMVRDLRVTRPLTWMPVSFLF